MRDIENPLTEKQLWIPMAMEIHSVLAGRHGPFSSSTCDPYTQVDVPHNRPHTKHCDESAVQFKRMQQWRIHPTVFPCWGCWTESHFLEYKWNVLKYAFKSKWQFRV